MSYELRLENALARLLTLPTDLKSAVWIRVDPKALMDARELLRVLERDEK